MSRWSIEGDYAADGAVCVPQAFTPSQVEWALEAIDANLADVSTRAKLAGAENDGAFIEDDLGRWRVLGWALDPGDAVFFNMLTVHGSGGVSGSNRRRVLSVRFLGDDMVHAPRRWKTSPRFDGLDAELAAGDPMDHPLFPMLWTRSGGLVAT